MSENNSRSMSDIFKKIADEVTGKQRDLFLEADDIKLKIDRERRIAELNCTLPRLYAKRDVYALEDKIRTAYDLSQMRILTHYAPELFSTDYLSEILTEAGRVGILCNGFFGRYDLETSDHKLIFKIPFTAGGISLLDLAKTARGLEGILYSEFGLSFVVEIRQREDAEAEAAAYCCHRRRPRAFVYAARFKAIYKIHYRHCNRCG